MRAITIFMLSVLLILSCKKHIVADETNPIIVLENAGVKLKVMTKGGRVIGLYQNNGSNIFKSPETISKIDVPEPQPNTQFVPINGHIVWAGPQQDFWKQQTVNKDLLKKESRWPPDPYLIYGAYQILRQTDTSVILKSPQSPVSGLQLTKNISIDHGGAVFFKVTGENIREEDTIAWDLWLNTRLDGNARCYVPVKDTSGIVRTKQNRWNKSITGLMHIVTEGFFTFIPQEVPENKSGRASKAFLIPNKPFMTGFTGEYALFIHFELYDPSLTHSDQSMIEIYNRVQKNQSENSILELEYHSHYKVLAPGDSISAYEKWEVFKYPGANTTNAHIDFIKSKVDTY
jgi:hypothetical protein